MSDEGAPPPPAGTPDDGSTQPSEPVPPAAAPAPVPVPVPVPTTTAAQDEAPAGRERPAAATVRRGTSRWRIATIGAAALAELVAVATAIRVLTTNFQPYAVVELVHRQRVIVALFAALSGSALALALSATRGDRPRGRLVVGLLVAGVIALGLALAAAWRVKGVQ